jgi:hypothetical protein
MDKVTHLAFSDESYTDSRFRSIASVSLPIICYDEITYSIGEAISGSGITEFKWSKLRQARERMAAIKIIDRIILFACGNKIRVDVLIWDIEDSRHKIKRRDDIANLQRMHYHLFHNVFINRWPSGASWAIHPDENSEMDWNTIVDCLDYSGTEINMQGFFNGKGSFMDLFKNLFKIVEISEVSSKEQCLCQVADLFAGIGAFSYSAFQSYNQWHYNKGGQFVLFSPNGLTTIINNQIGHSEEERFVVMEHLDQQCKKHKMHVGLINSKGYKSYNPVNPINFWFYEPQRQSDKAPLKE